MNPISVPELELRILGVLWDAHETLSVQEVLDRWPRDSPGYTTILKKLQVMEQKGLVSHHRSGKSYLYAPEVSRAEVTRWKLGDLLSQLFRGDKMRMMHAFLKESDLTKEEIEEMRRLIDETESQP